MTPKVYPSKMLRWMEDNWWCEECARKNNKRGKWKHCTSLREHIKDEWGSKGMTREDHRIAAEVLGSEAKKT